MARPLPTIALEQDPCAKRAVSHGMKSEFCPSDEETDEAVHILRELNLLDELILVRRNSVRSQESETGYGSSYVSVVDFEDGSGTEDSEQPRVPGPAGHSSRDSIWESEMRPKKKRSCAVAEIAEDAVGSQDGSESRGTELPQVPNAAGYRWREALFELSESGPGTGIGEKHQHGSATGHTHRKTLRRSVAPGEWIKSHPKITLVVLILLLVLVLALVVSLSVCSGKRQGQAPIVPDTPVLLLCCPHDWIGYNGSCYFLSRDHLSWDQAQAQCTELGASLAVLRDEEMEFLFSIIGNVDYWVGLRRREQRLQWGDGSSFSSSFDVQGNAECVHLAEDYLGSAICSNPMQYLCSRPQTPQ